MRSVAAGAIAHAIGAILVITLVNYESTKNGTSPPGSTSSTKGLTTDALSGRDLNAKSLASHVKTPEWTRLGVESPSLPIPRAALA